MVSLIVKISETLQTTITLGPISRGIVLGRADEVIVLYFVRFRRASRSALRHMQGQLLTENSLLPFLFTLIPAHSDTRDTMACRIKNHFCAILRYFKILSNRRVFSLYIITAVQVFLFLPILCYIMDRKGLLVDSLPSQLPSRVSSVVGLLGLGRKDERSYSPSLSTSLHWKHSL